LACGEPHSWLGFTRAQADFTFVARDPETNRAAPVPMLMPSTPREMELFNKYEKKSQVLLLLRPRRTPACRTKRRSARMQSRSVLSPFAPAYPSQAGYVDGRIHWGNKDSMHMAMDLLSQARPLVAATPACSIDTVSD
jgi:hypothetical protein